MWEGVRKMKVTKRVWWNLSKLHIIGSRDSRTACGILYQFDRGGGIVSSQWGLRESYRYSKKVNHFQGRCLRCAQHELRGFQNAVSEI